MSAINQAKAFAGPDNQSRVLRYLPLPLARTVRRVRNLPDLIRNFTADLRVYLFHASNAGITSHEQAIARIIATYHNIEKGLSLPSPRPGFGERNLRILLDLLALPRLDQQHPSVIVARHVLAAYLAFNEEVGCNDVPYRGEIEQAVARLVELRPGSGGLRKVTKADVIAATEAVTDRFFLERHSVRQFSGEPVETAAIERAVTLALKSPAVCNRQNSKVYVASDPEVKQRLLKFQGGSNGFGEGIDKVLIVTVRLSYFWGSGERHQAWVDGGLFSMSLLLGLHSQALGAVCLNWSRSTADSEKLRDMVGMEKDEIVIMMIGVGHLRDEFVVPVSHRRSASAAMIEVSGLRAG